MINIQDLETANYYLRILQRQGLKTIVLYEGKNNFIFEKENFLKSIKDYKKSVFRTLDREALEKECSDFVITAFVPKEKSEDETIECLISKLDDMMEKETNTERKEGLYEAYAELLKVRK